MYYLLLISPLLFQAVLAAPFESTLARRIISNQIDPPPQDRPWVPGKDEPGQGPYIKGTSYSPGVDLQFSVNGNSEFFRDKDGFGPFGGLIPPKEISPEIASWPGGRPDPSNEELAATGDTPITWVGKPNEDSLSVERPDLSDTELGGCELPK
ncbi:hypothetical protein BDV24DRAFT_170334 [Aspergillus arachidicola]|uniref:Uncharacterized protein n=1 Tax=Aspergillus arachidicola TaxID=656916 RepID=A0A5N6XN47_9EURO|nr:hypothetical protein BDV24DRAFT_170334 [Aspergillus arachidicola]